MAIDPTQHALLLSMARIMTARRHALGWSFRDLHKRSGIAPSVLHKYENGQMQNAPRIDMLVKLAIALGLTGEELLAPYLAYINQTIGRV